MAGAPDGDCLEVAAIRPTEEEDSESEVEVVEGSEGERIRAKSEQENIKIMTDPRKPTDKEVDIHNLTHLPYRNWCDVCIAAKGKDLDHRKDVREARGLPEYRSIIAFRVMSSVTTSPFWWAARGPPA